MPKTRAFSRKPVPGYGDSRYNAPVMEQAPVTKSWEEIKTEEAKAYLASQRKANAGYQYLQTVLGEINGGRLSMSDLTVDELQALLAQEWEFKQAEMSLGTDAGLAKIKAVMDAALSELQKQGGTWTEPSAPVKDDPINPPTPPHDPSRGR